MKRTDLTPRVRRLINVVATEAHWLEQEWWEESHNTATVFTKDLTQYRKLHAEKLKKALVPFRRVRESVA